MNAPVGRGGWLVPAALLFLLCALAALPACGIFLWRKATADRDRQQRKAVDEAADLAAVYAMKHNQLLPPLSPDLPPLPQDRPDLTINEFRRLRPKQQVVARAEVLPHHPGGDGRYTGAFLGCGWSHYCFRASDTRDSGYIDVYARKDSDHGKILYEQLKGLKPNETRPYYLLIQWVGPWGEAPPDKWTDQAALLAAYRVE